MRKLHFLPLAMIAALLLSSSAFAASDESGETAASEEMTGAYALLDTENMFTNRDLRIAYDIPEDIFLSDDGIETASENVSADGSVITITGEGVYRLTGSISDGMIVIDVDDTEKVQLVLDGVSITSLTTPAIYVRQADKVFLTLEKESENFLENGGTFSLLDEKEAQAVIVSRDDLTLNGAGSLTITSPAGGGIDGKDDLVITSGSYTISAAGHALEANNSIRIADGNFTIFSGKDGFHAENTGDASLGYVYIQDGSFTLTCDGDGISAGSVLLIEDGDFTIFTGASYTTVETTAETENLFNSYATPQDVPSEEDDISAKGLKSIEDITVAGGTFSLNTMDDAIHSSGDIYILGGVFSLTCDGDGISAGSALLIEDGDFTILTGGGYTEADTAAESGNFFHSYIAPQNVLSEEDDISAKGLKSAEDITVTGGIISLNTVDDAVHSNRDINILGGSFSITAGDDAIHADETLSIQGGSIDISYSYEGLESTVIDISGGEISIVSADDGINAGGGADSSGFGNMGNMSPGWQDSFAESDAMISISGGTIYVDAAGDGLDANGSLYVSGGTIIVAGPTDSMNGPVDYDRDAAITGGTLIAYGTAGNQAQNFGSGSTQGSIMVYPSQQAAGTEITLTAADGTVLAECTATKTYSLVIVSSPALVLGETYTLTAGSYEIRITLSSLVYGASAWGNIGGGGRGF